MYIGLGSLSLQRRNTGKICLQSSQYTSIVLRLKHLLLLGPVKGSAVQALMVRDGMYELTFCGAG